MDAFTPALNAWRTYDNDGIPTSESTSTPLAAQDVAPFIENTDDVKFHLRLRVDEVGAGSIGGASTDDWQLQFRVNGAGAWNDVNVISSRVRAVDGQLSNGAATTNRSQDPISDPGSGSFVAGEQEENNGLIENHQLTADNFTEHVYCMELVAADNADGDFLEFRLRLNGGAMDNNVTPRVDITVAAVLGILRPEFPSDVSLYAHGVTGPELGITVAPLPDDAVIVADIPQREIPADISLYTQPTTPAELGFQTPAGFEDAIVQREVPGDVSLFAEPVISPELGFTHAPLSADAPVPEPPLRTEFPQDISLYQQQEILSELSFTHSPLPGDAPVVVDPPHQEIPADLAPFQHEPTEAEKHFHSSPMDPGAIAPSSREIPADIGRYQPPPSDDELGITRPPLSADLPPVAPPSPRAEIPQDISSYVPDPTADEQTFTRSTPPDSIHIPASHREIPGDISAFSPGTIEDEFTFTAAPLPADVAAVDPLASNVYPDSVAEFTPIPTIDELTWTRSTPPEDLPPAAIPHNEMPVDAFHYEFAPIEDQKFLIRTPLPESVSWVDKGMPFLHTGSNWGGSELWHLEVVMRSTTGIVQARVYNKTDGLGLPSSQVAAPLTIHSRIRSAGFTLIDGKEYVVQFGTAPADAGAWKLARLIRF